MGYQDQTTAASECVALGAGQQPNIYNYVSDNQRLLEELHKSISALAEKLTPVVVKQDASNKVGAGSTSTAPPTSELAATLANQGAEISSAIRRINEIRYAVDLP